MPPDKLIVGIFQGKSRKAQENIPTRQEEAQAEPGIDFFIYYFSAKKVVVKKTGKKEL